MTKTEEFSITPLPRKRISVKEVDPSKVSVGCMPPLIAGSVVYGVVGSVSMVAGQFLLGQDASGFGLTFSLILGIVFGFVYAKWKRIGLLEELPRKQEEEIRRAEEVALRAARNEAQEVTERARVALERLRQLKSDISGPLEKASETLKEARQEYEERAFATFWDRVESAAIDLGGFLERIQELNSTLSQYRGLLRGRIHNFPTFVLAPGSTPDPIPVLEEFREVARLGEKDFQFAMIWEQRKTREVLVAGFHTLEDAVQNLGRSLERSMDELGTSITVDVGRAIEKGARDRSRQLDAAGRQVKLLEQIRDDNKRQPS